MTLAYSVGREIVPIVFLNAIVAVLTMPAARLFYTLLFIGIS